MMSDDISGEEMLAQNMAALESGEDMPHVDYDEGEQAEHTEDAIVEDSEPEVVEDIEEEVPEAAKKDGFMSKQEWIDAGKDPDEYMTPAEFARVGELRDGSDTRQKLAKQLVQQEAVLKEIIANQNKMQSDTEARVRAETIQELEAKKKEAIDYGETEKAINIDREIQQHESQANQAQQPEVTPVQQDMEAWYKNNDDWYGTHTNATDMLNVELKRAERQNIPFNEAVKAAEAKVKSQFGYLFDSNEKPAAEVRPKAISTKSRKPAKQAKAKLSVKSLPPELQAMARQVIKKTGITEQEYMESYNG